MGNIIFSATGCTRCKIAKNYMKANGIPVEEFDIKAEGKNEFARFYRENRTLIFRDESGVEFPVFTDGTVIRQGVGVIIGYLATGDKTAGFIGRSLLHGEWLNGINVSGGSLDYKEDLLSVMTYLKGSGLKIEVASDGRNSALLESLLDRNLADRVIMEVKGPSGLWETMVRAEGGLEDLVRSLAIAARFPEYQFYTTLGPVVRTPGDSQEISFLTPDEIGETAKLIEAATGSKRHPFLLRPWRAEKETDERLKFMDPLPESILFKYRTMARRYLVTTEIAKE